MTHTNAAAELPIDNAGAQDPVAANEANASRLLPVHPEFFFDVGGAPRTSSDMFNALVHKLRAG